jgi:hypothetical protein
VSNYDDSGPAFPVHETPDSTDSPGMTLRDYFAAKAMQALIAKGMDDYTKRASKGVPVIAGYAYEYADAMLQERAK